MSTTVEITCQGTVKVLPIHHPICRIGSNPSLELCIPGIDDHTVTLRIHGGKRHIYNRSSKPVTLDGKRVQPEQTSEWHGNQVLELADKIRLRLLNSKGEDKTSPSLPNVSISGEIKQAAVSKAPDKNGRRFAIASFFLVFATILYSSESETNNQLADQEFSSVITALAEAESVSNSGRYRQMRVELQNAVLRSDLKEQAVQNVRQLLLSTSHLPATAIDFQVRRFTETYL